MEGSDGPGGGSGGPGGGSTASTTASCPFKAPLPKQVGMRESTHPTRTTRTIPRTARITFIRITKVSSRPCRALYMYGSDGPGGDSGGPGGGSETVFGTDVRNRQCAEQCSEPTKASMSGLGALCAHRRRAAAGRKPSGRRAEPPPPKVLIMPLFTSGFRIKKPIGRPF